MDRRIVTSRERFTAVLGGRPRTRILQRVRPRHAGSATEYRDGRCGIAAAFSGPSFAEAPTIRFSVSRFDSHRASERARYPPIARADLKGSRVRFRYCDFLLGRLTRLGQGSVEADSRTALERASQDGPRGQCRRRGVPPPIPWRPNH